jgi:hypothetical protein
VRSWPSDYEQPFGLTCAEKGFDVTVAFEGEAATLLLVY